MVTLYEAETTDGGRTRVFGAVALTMGLWVALQAAADPAPTTVVIDSGPIVGRWIAGRASSGQPSWLYYFSYVPAATRPTLPGSAHASEIRYVFDSWDKSGGTPDADARALTAVMHGCWVAYAKTGRVDGCTPGGWPAYDPARDQLFEFGVSSGVRTHFRKPYLDAQQAAKAGVVSGR